MCQAVGVGLRGWRRGGFVNVWLMFDKLNFKKKEGKAKRGKSSACPRRKEKERTKLPSVSQSYNFWVPHKRTPPYHYSKEKTRLWNQKSTLGEEKGKEVCKWDRIYPEIITLAVIAGLLVNHLVDFLICLLRCWVSFLKQALYVKGD